MIRYTLRQGELRPDATGKWVSFADVAKLEALVREARKLQLGGEIADRFGFGWQANPALSTECGKFRRNFHAETERMIQEATT